MIEITPAAQEYFGKLLAQQDAEDLALRIQVQHPGTPKAACDLQFCPDGHQARDDRSESFEHFTLYVAADSVTWLEDALIDFEAEDTGGQLTIKAPNIKGDVPADNAPLADRVRWVIDSEINPQLASHGGMVSLEGITDDMQVVLRFGGGCHGCGMADVTLKEGIEKTLKGQFPEIAGLLDATDHATGENPYY